MNWKISKAKYISGEDLFLGRIRVGSAHYDGMTPKGSDEKYRAGCILPGMLSMTEHFKTIEEAKSCVEAYVAKWLEHAGLERLKALEAV